MRHRKGSRFVRWRLDLDNEFACLSNVGNSTAVDVRVQLRRGSAGGSQGALVFASVPAGTVLRLCHLAHHPTDPPWTGITVTWRRAGWLAGNRRLRWDATVVTGPPAVQRTTPRPLPTSPVRVPRPRRPSSV